MHNEAASQQVTLACFDAALLFGDNDRVVHHQFTTIIIISLHIFLYIAGHRPIHLTLEYSHPDETNRPAKIVAPPNLTASYHTFANLIVCLHGRKT